MFNQRRKHSAYLSYDDGKVRSIEPNSTKEKVQNLIDSHKKDSFFSGKDFISIIVFIILTILFLFVFNHFISLLSLDMLSTNTKYTEISSEITEKTSNISIKERKKNESLNETMSLFVSSVNNYNSEISSIYSSLKGYISIYYKGKEGIYMTQRSLTSMIKRIDLDLSIVESDPTLTDKDELKRLFKKRLNNIQTYLNTELSDNREIAVENLNNLILNENKQDINCKNEVIRILDSQNIQYQITNDKFIIKNSSSK